MQWLTTAQRIHPWLKKYELCAAGKSTEGLSVTITHQTWFDEKLCQSHEQNY